MDLMTRASRNGLKCADIPGIRLPFYLHAASKNNFSEILKSRPSRKILFSSIYLSCYKNKKKKKKMLSTYKDDSFLLLLNI